MGMNFYLVSVPCEKCGYKHIGKSSYGWQFHFRGYTHEGIICYEDWMREINRPDVTIVDEDNEPISAKDFEAKVERNKNDLNHFNIVNRMPQTEKEREYLADHPPGYPPSSQVPEWNDENGYTFTDWEFS